MKKILILLLVVSSTVSIAQESVTLRINYEKGEKYLMKMTQTMTSAQMMMTNNMEMNMEITDKKDGVYTSQAKISKVVMNMMQGAMQMSYDSSKKNEELDQMGLALKAQVDPLLTVVVTTKTDQLGKVSDISIEPAVPGSEQLKNQASISFPEKAVKVGDSWTNENENQGMKMSTDYKVTKITDDKVFLSVSGTVSGAGTGSIKGTFEINRNTGLTLKSSVDTAIKAQGQEVNVGVEMTMEKI